MLIKNIKMYLDGTQPSLKFLLCVSTRFFTLTMVKKQRYHDWIGWLESSLVIEVYAFLLECLK